MQPENQCSLLCEREKSQKVPQGSVDATGNLSQVLPHTSWLGVIPACKAASPAKVCQIQQGPL